MFGAVLGIRLLLPIKATNKRNTELLETLQDKR